MSYRIPLPDGGRATTLDILEPNSTAVQRFIRRSGLGEYERSTAAAVLALCESRDPGFVFFDVGANMGLYGGMAAALFSPRMVHLFEPAPAAADVGRRIMSKNRLAAEVFEAAVSDSTGRAALHLSPVSDASNSLVEGFRKATGQLDVETIRLDDHVERTGLVPDIVKIDVETHENAVLAGAGDVIAAHRPAMVVEVLRRRGRDHGEELTDLMAPHGYHYYQLDASPDFVVRPAMSGSGTVDRDWLLLPEPITDELIESWRRWEQRLSECTVDRNPRPPVGRTIRAAYERGGFGEVIAATRRYLTARRDKRTAL